MEARIYLRTSYHGLRKAEGCYCGILEADTSEGEKTLEETGKDTGTDSKYLESGVNRFLDDWIAADFRKQNGEPVKNSVLWKRAAELLAPHNINICYEEHTKYSMWQDRRMREYEQEQKNKSVHLR